MAVQAVAGGDNGGRSLNSSSRPRRIRELFPEKSGETKETFLRPDRAPRRSHRAEPLTGGLAACAASAVMSLTRMACAPGVVAFPSTPHTALHRAARRSPGCPRTATALPISRRRWHTAPRLRRSAAGAACWPAMSAAFLSRHPEFARQRISKSSAFSTASRPAFFGRRAATASARCQRCAPRV